MECTGIVITGAYAQGPAGVAGNWAILGKNSDTNNNGQESPIHNPRKTFNLTYATSAGQVTVSVQSKAYTGNYGGVQSGVNMPPELPIVVFGMNENGLACFYTLLGSTYPSNSGMCATAEWQAEVTNPLGIKTTGRALCTMILAFYENVYDVLNDLNNPDSMIGSNNRGNADSIGIVDRFGNGMVLEVSRQKVVYKIVSGYFCEDNAMRLWDLNNAGEATTIRSEAQSGNRTAYIKEAVDEIIASKGYVSYRDAVQKLMRFIHHKEDGASLFSVNESGKWEIINDGTSSGFLAITGDDMYDGALNGYFGASGNPMFLGVYELHIPLAGDIPLNGAGAWGTGMPATSMRRYIDNGGGVSGAGGLRDYAGDYSTSWIYDPAKVKEIQAKVFPAEVVSFNRYEQMLLTIPTGLTESQLISNYLKPLVDLAQTEATQAFIASQVSYTLTFNSKVTMNDGTVVSPAGIPVYLPDNTPVTDGTVLSAPASSTITLRAEQTINVEPPTPETIIVNSIIYVDSMIFDGGGKIYKHGPSLGDSQIFKLIGNNAILQNVILDDDWFSGVQAVVFDSGNGNAMTGITLKNCKRYGLATLGATNFHIHHNIIESAQHCISGSGAISKGGLVEYNTILSLTNDAFKCKSWQNVEVRYNTAHLTPAIATQTASTSGVSFNSDLPNLNMNIYIHDNDFIKEDSQVQSFGLATEGLAQSSKDANGNYIEIEDVQGDLSLVGTVVYKVYNGVTYYRSYVSNLRFVNNRLIKMASSTQVFWAGYMHGNYVTIAQNTFTNLRNPPIGADADSYRSSKGISLIGVAYPPLEGNITTPNTIN